MNKSNKGIILNFKFQLYILIGILAYSVCFNLITRSRFDLSSFMLTLLLMVIQVEVFAWIGFVLFKELVYNSVKEFIRRLIPRLLLFYLVVIIVAGILFVAVSALWSYFQGGDLTLFFKQLPEKELRGFIIGSSFGLLTGTAIFFFIELVAVIRKGQKINEERMRYHYETLKNQLNPHFLFNSLNTLSSIIYQDVQLADKFIVKLSSVYRYILDQQEIELVSLDSELDFVRDFFYLQQLRDGDRIHLEIDVDQPSGYMILPVSLQLLVENALKHNMATAEKPLRIRISQEDGLSLAVENNRQPKQQLEGTFRIGLKNLNERLLMITGKELVVEKSIDTFLVKMPISSL